MKTYTFKITQVETFIDERTYEAHSLDAAIAMAKVDGNNSPPDGEKNTYCGCDIEVSPIPDVINSEGLLGDDPEDSFGVILVEDLSDEQRNYLGID